MGSLANLSRLQYGIIALTVVTAVIHLGLGFGFANTLFILNGLGYIGLAGLLYVVSIPSIPRDLVRWVFIAYTALTIVLFFVFNWPDVFGPLGLLTKAVEVILIVLLWQDRPA